MRNVYKILFSKPEGNRPFGRYGVDRKIKGSEWETVNWIHLAQDKGHYRTVMNTAMNLRIKKRREISGLAEKLVDSQK
jgi:hypothetical protein